MNIKLIKNNKLRNLQTITNNINSDVCIHRNRSIIKIDSPMKAKNLI